MITVPEVVEKLVKQSPLLEEALSLDIINLSSLARKLQPQIKQKLYKDVQNGAIVMALKRLSSKLKTNPGSQISSIPVADLTVRSNLIEFTFRNSSTLIEKQEKLLKLAGREQNAFLTFTRGLFETTLIVSSSLEETVLEILKEEEITSKITQLSTITLILPKKTIFQSGVYYHILKELFWEKINIVETVSSLNELTIILKSSETEKAFSVLNNLT